MLSPDVGAVRHGSAAVADHAVLFFAKNIVFRFFILFSLSIINYILLILLLIIVFSKVRTSR